MDAVILNAKPSVCPACSKKPCQVCPLLFPYHDTVLQNMYSCLNTNFYI